MKHTSKILIALLVLATMLMSMAVLTASAETATKVFDATEYLATDPDLTNIGEETAAGTEYPAGDMTIISGKSMKFDTSGEYDDGKTFSKGLKPGGKSSVSGNTVVRSIMFEVSGPATVKIWWRCGGDPKNNVPRYIAIWNASSTEVASAHKEDAAKDSCYISELSVEEAGKYYIVCPIDQNVIHRVEVTETASSGGDVVECEHSWTDATCTAPKTCSLCNATEGEALGHTEGTPATCVDKAVCSVCTQAYGETLPHDWDEGVVSTEATCTEQGKIKYTCKNECGSAKTSVLPYAHKLDESGLCTKCNVYPFDPATLTAEKDKEALTDSVYNVFFSYGGSGSTKRVNNGSVYAVELSKGAGSWITFTLKHKTTVTFAFASTGGSNVSTFNIKDSSGNYVYAEDLSVTGTTAIVETKELEAGTYSIVNTSSGRGGRLHYVNVGYVACDYTTEDETKRVEPTCIAVGSKTLVCVCGAEKVEELPVVEHPFATEWSRDAENHWYKCTTEGCTEISSKAVHNLVENDQGNNVCSECGYDAGHTCDYSVAKNDETHHWNQCSKCENITEKAEHVWSKDAVTCTEGRSCDCGRKEAALGHAYVNGFCSRCFAVDYNYEFVYKFNAATDVTLGADKDPITPITTIYNGYFMVVGDVKQRVNNDAVYALELAKNGGGSLAFTINGTATVTIEFASTSGSNISAVGLYDGRGNMVLADDFRWEVEGTAPVKFTYTLKSGTYYIVSLIENKGYNRGARLHTVEVKTKLCEHTYEAGRVEPTCVLTGGDAQICSKCNHTVITNEEPAKGHSWLGSLCSVCYAANPNYIANNVVVGENKVVVNEHHLVADGEGQHGKPYEFPFLTIEKAGHYRFVSDKNLSVFIYTTEITAEGADFTPGTGASWNVYVISEAYLEPGTYYIGFIYLDGIGEYNVKVEEYTPHEHKFENGKCECGESDPNYVPPVEPQPEPELNFFQKIWQAILAFFQKILGFFKK